MRTCGPAALALLWLYSPLCQANRDATTIDKAGYTERLKGFYGVLDGCARSMSQLACDAKLAGPDVIVRTADGSRRVDFDWLRGALTDAAQAFTTATDAKDPQAKPTRSAASEELRQAHLRLDQELARQDQLTPRNVDAERAQLGRIIAQGGYAGEAQPSFLARLWNALAEWLNRRLYAVTASQTTEFITNLLLGCLLAVICGALLWWFARRVRNQGLALGSSNGSLSTAPSSVGWENWLADGKGLAREQRWREAIHSVYWSAISLLESRGFWPADRTRTPREYLGLLAARPEKIVDLQALTRSFEHTWYGHGSIGQADFDRACALLERLAR
jgi:hypothetical protein